MTEPITIDPKHTAVVIMDYQAGVAAMLPEPEPLLRRAASVLEAARCVTLPVIHVLVEFRPGHPEIHPRNVGFADRIKRNGLFLAGSREAQVLPAVAPQDVDIVVTKRRIGAFTGTELDMVLRSLDIDTLILFGIMTSGAVLTTVRQAFDADYRLILVSDCCADADSALHATLMDKVLGRQAFLTTAEELALRLRAIH
jgi:nicotinamidase-related amidase